MDFTIVTLVFFGIGALVDRLAGTTPLFMIVFVVLAFLGLGARAYYGYNEDMKAHDEARAERLRR